MPALPYDLLATMCRRVYQGGREIQNSEPRLFSYPCFFGL